MLVYPMRLHDQQYDRLVCLDIEYTPCMVTLICISKEYDDKPGNAGIPSGKHTKNYGKSQFSMGKVTINDHFQ